MLSYPLYHQPESIWSSIKLSIKLWVAKTFKWSGTGFTAKVVQSVSNDIVGQTKYFESIILKAPSFTVDQARRNKVMLLKIYPTLERLDRLVTALDDTTLKMQMKVFMKSVFKYEAILSKVETSKNQALETPRYLSDGISKMGMESIGMK
ncbi:hypothetical protein [Dyadobacter bucti]|uniref:hypothetical protein n=1 Tax=Dyadobacter bucti TaxID=2572203 RepID=UPI003F6E9C80